ncbi:MAG: YkgJ family cysteine cluster protein [Candidatus Diapherotrites archaeon]|nr:YkgJ family cysteine cluster protein [Candidatus Diapherotrites archaeon]
MKVDCLGLKCDECCKRYWITVLPKELKKAAKQQKISEKKFIGKYCVLHLNFFPADGSTGSLAVPSVFLPKPVARKLSKELGILPLHFIVLPSIAFKRSSQGACVFLSNKKCKIYSARPRQCVLFPFISMEKADLKKLYPFCKALQKSKPRVLLEKSQVKNVTKYFDSVAKKGFLKIWSALPSKGLICLKNWEIGKISKKDFLKIIEFL